MNLLEAVAHRHSIRAYKAEPLDARVVKEIQSYIEEMNQESGLHMQFIQNEGDAFQGFLAHYGGFRNVQNYIALVGKDDASLDERCGYYGEKIVLYLEQLGLSSCWVGGTFKKGKAKYQKADEERLCLVITLGIADGEGRTHACKDRSMVMQAKDPIPTWFLDGVDCALKAPTALNQQKFHFTLLNGDIVKAESGRGPFSKVDLGIVKYHFEIGANGYPFKWE